MKITIFKGLILFACVFMTGCTSSQHESENTENQNVSQLNASRYQEVSTDDWATDDASEMSLLSRAAKLKGVDATVYYDEESYTAMVHILPASSQVDAVSFDKVRLHKVITEKNGRRKHYKLWLDGDNVFDTAPYEENEPVFTLADFVPISGTVQYYLSLYLNNKLQAQTQLDSFVADVLPPDTWLGIVRDQKLIALRDLSLNILLNIGKISTIMIFFIVRMGDSQSYQMFQVFGRQ